MKVLTTIIFCSLLLACGKNNNSGNSKSVYSQAIESSEISRSGYQANNGFMQYAYLLMSLDSRSPIRDFYLTSSRNPNLDQQVKASGTIMFGRFKRATLSQMDHLKRDLEGLSPNQRLDEIERISNKAIDQNFFYIENSFEIFNAENGTIEIVFLLENNSKVVGKIRL